MEIEVITHMGVGIIYFFLIHFFFFKLKPLKTSQYANQDFKSVPFLDTDYS